MLTAAIEGRQYLWSASQWKMIVPCYRLNSFGPRCFAVACLLTWKWSASQWKMIVPCYRLNSFGPRCFAVACLLTWKWSASQWKMTVPCYRLNSFGPRCFAVACLLTWNWLPDSVCDQELSEKTSIKDLPPKKKPILPWSKRIYVALEAT